MKPRSIRVHAPHLQPAGRDQTEISYSPAKTVKFNHAEYGPMLWEKLHRRAFRWEGGSDNDWLDRFERSVPCGACRNHWKKILEENPPDWANYFEWSVERHNDVNASLGKPILSLAEARLMWGYD